MDGRSLVGERGCSICICSFVFIIIFIDYDLAFDRICLQNIESAIREKFDDRHVRIFQILCMKGYLDEEQVRLYTHDF